MKNRTLITAAIFAAVATAAPAQEHYFSRGSWGVWRYDDSCTMGSENIDDGSYIDFYAENLDTVSIIFGNHNWSLDPDVELPMLIDIDYNRWDAVAVSDEEYILVYALKYSFLKDVMRGSAIALITGSGERVMTYSLRGSSASMQAFAHCLHSLDPLR